MWFQNIGYVNLKYFQAEEFSHLSAAKDKNPCSTLLFLKIWVLQFCHRKVCQSIPNLIFRKEKEKNMLNNRCHKKVCQCALNAIILVINFVTEKYASPFHILIMWICKNICHKKVCHYALNTKIWVIDFVTEKYASISQISFFWKRRKYAE